VIGWLLYTWARTIAPPFTPTGEKTMPYVGGEVAEAGAIRPSYQFFYVALFFTIVHVAALILAVAPADAGIWATGGYLLIVAVAILVLRYEQ
jgi:NADH:ubiquinone oxidoreductase subunit 3 (subunit A)